MPPTDVFFYQEERGRAPVVEWLREIRRSDRRAYAKCVARIQRLAEVGHALRRPEADYVRDGLYELRARQGHIQYRILYFFHGRNVAILAHGITKEGALPEADLARALRRKDAFTQHPEEHTYEEDEAASDG